MVPPDPILPIDREDHQERLAYLVAIGEGQLVVGGDLIVHAGRFAVAVDAEDSEVDGLGLLDL